MSDQMKPTGLARGQRIARRRFLGRAAALGLTSTLVPNLISDARAADAPRRGGTLIAGVKGGSTTDSLDPTIVLSQVPNYLVYVFGNRLVARSVQGPLEGELAESWEAEDDAKRWVFKLRKGIQFHNGKEFTSADMVYSLNRHRGPNSKSGAAGLMKNIDDIKAGGPYELTFLLKASDVNLPYLMTNTQLIAIPDDAPPDKGIGTGPFVVDTAKPGERYTFHRNPHYFKPNVPWVDRVEVVVINDETARLSALLSSTVHLITDVPPLLVDHVKKSGPLKVDTATSTLFYYFVMQCDKPPFDNPDLRLALKYAVDRQSLLKRVLGGYGSVGNDSPINSVYPLYSSDIPVHSYDPDKAQYYYKKSGHSGPVVLQISDAAFPGANDAGQVFQQDAAKAGITIELKREPADGYWDNVWLKSPFCASYWGSLSTEDEALSQPFLSATPWNDSHWYRPEFDKLVLAARSELDPERRKALYRRAVMMVHDDGGHITLMFSDDITGMTEKLQGFVGDHFHAGGKNTERCWFSA